MGLVPYGDSATYLQAFHFAAPPGARGEQNNLQLGRNKLKPGADFYPVSWSPSPRCSRALRAAATASRRLSWAATISTA